MENMFTNNPMDRLGKEYLEHDVFRQLTELADFYDSISYSTMLFINPGTKAVNLNTYVFTSMKGTLESIHDVLKRGRINDGYALLRKYFDATVINVYANLYLADNYSLENLVVEQINNWLQGVQTMPEYRVISKYIKESPTFKPITDLLQHDNRYKIIRERCNDHTHYNYYHNLLLNDNEIHSSRRVEALNVFSSDLTAIFVQHFAYLFYLHDHYMMSSDYVDYRDVGMTPPEDAQYWVSPFIQKIFDDWIKANRPDIANEIKSKTSMQLE